tara:strand:- start:2388 stop:4244 length:1857 start_codon:yes stop_codon:yes gene_type:complete
MRFLLVAILFAVTVGGFTLATKLGYQTSLEAELAQTALGALDEAGYDGVVVEFDHHDVLVSGFVDSPEDRDKVMAIVLSAVPGAHRPENNSPTIAIRPTLPPRILLVRKPGEGGGVRISGVMAADEESNRALLGSRLHVVSDGVEIENGIKLDPKRLPFSKAPEIASLAEGLMTHSESARISLNEGCLTISGKVPNDGIRQSLLELAALIGADSINDEITVAEPVLIRKPSQFSITRNRFGIIISGSVGSEESRSRLLEILGLESKGQVTDRIEIQEDLVPGIWEESAAEVLPILLTTLIGELTAEFTPERVRLTGRVAQESDRKSVVEKLTLFRVGPQPPELLMDMSIEEEASDGPLVRIFAVCSPERLSLTGNVPNADFVAKLEKLVKAKSPDIVIENNLEVTPSSPGSEWVAGLPDFFSELPGRVESAIISFEGSTVSMEGETMESADGLLLHNIVINTVPGTFTIKNRLKLKVVEPPSPPKLLPKERMALTAKLKDFPVYFGSNSEVIQSDEQEKITSISELIKEAGVPLTLMVTGFADNVGNSSYNRELSLRRANSVVNSLVSQGITKDTMSTSSIGEDVSNVSRSERWKARRVEVSLKKPEAENPDEANTGQ